MEPFSAVEFIFPMLQFYDKFSELLGSKERKHCEYVCACVCVCVRHPLLCCFQRFPPGLG